MYLDPLLFTLYCVVEKKFPINLHPISYTDKEKTYFRYFCKFSIKNSLVLCRTTSKLCILVGNAVPASCDK